MHGINMTKKILYSTILAILALPLFALASDMQQQQSTLYPFRSTVELQEEFLTGTNATGTIGSLGWTAANGAVSAASTANAPGYTRRDTSAAAGTIASTFHHISGSLVDPTLNHSILWRVRIVTNDNATTVRAGEAAPPTTNPPTSGIYFERLDTDTNWFCVTRSAGVQTRTDSTIATTGNFVNLSYTRNSSGVMWSIDGVAVCGTSTTNIPTAFTLAFTQVINTGAVAKQLDHDYFQLRIVGITR